MKTKNKHHWARENKQREVKKTKVIRNVLAKILAILFLGVAVYSFVFAGFLKIDNIEVTGLETLDKEEVRSYVNEGLKGNYLEFIPKNNILFINKKVFKNKIKSEFKKIESITVKKVFPSKVVLDIEERDLMLMLCSKGECFFVDKLGNAYARVDFDSEEVRQNKLVKLIDESGKDVHIGRRVLREDFLRYISSLAQEIERVSHIEITKDYRSRSLISEEVIVQTTKGWDIYLSSAFPAEKSARILKTFLNKQISLREASELEYVDLRSENKVFYRMKGDGAVEEESEEGSDEEEEGEKEEGDV
jgi:cell division septal protein FtsQ